MGVPEGDLPRKAAGMAVEQLVQGPYQLGTQRVTHGVTHASRSNRTGNGHAGATTAGDAATPGVSTEGLGSAIKDQCGENPLGDFLAFRRARTDRPDGPDGTGRAGP
ncbi:hypothetical protein GCM10010389_63780 [Streptomyces echinoruber]|uniref:Uncharacterized protein n=1 Tax=Streptomyces echinoruber TaxID=68898 RepID=A0A918VRK1_9ACTN|nr:hypothetical protein GCM10010389_63780 [Streptomyces echinoruber]